MERPAHIDPITGDDVSALFHGTSAVDAILAEGLVPDDGLSDEGMLGEGVTHAVFLTTDPDEAATYGSHVLRVNAAGLDLIVVDGPNGWHYACAETITPDRITLAHLDH